MRLEKVSTIVGNQENQKNVILKLKGSFSHNEDGFGLHKPIAVLHLFVHALLIVVPQCSFNRRLCRITCWKTTWFYDTFKVTTLRDYGKGLPNTVLKPLTRSNHYVHIAYLLLSLQLVDRRAGKFQVALLRTLV